MDKHITDASDGPAPEVLPSLDELAREGARRMIAAAGELTGYLVPGSSPSVLVT